MDSSWTHAIGVCLSTVVSVVEAVGITLVRKSHIIYAKYEKLLEATECDSASEGDESGGEEKQGGKKRKMKTKRKCSFLNISIKSLQISGRICHRKGKVKESEDGGHQLVKRTPSSGTNGGEDGEEEEDPLSSSLMEKSLSVNLAPQDGSHFDQGYFSPFNISSEGEKIGPRKYAYITRTNNPTEEHKREEGAKQSHQTKWAKNCDDSSAEWLNEPLDVHPSSCHLGGEKHPPRWSNLSARGINKKVKRREKCLWLSKGPTSHTLGKPKRSIFYTPFCSEKKGKEWKRLLILNGHCRKSKTGVEGKNYSTCGDSTQRGLPHLGVTPPVEDAAAGPHNNNMIMMSISHIKMSTPFKSESPNRGVPDGDKMYYCSFRSDRFADRLSGDTGCSEQEGGARAEASLSKNGHENGLQNGRKNSPQNSPQNGRENLLGRPGEKEKYSDEEEITRCSSLKMDHENGGGCPDSTTTHLPSDVEGAHSNVRTKSYICFYLGIALTSFIAPALNIFNNIFLPMSMVGFVSVRLMCSLLLERFVLKEQQSIYLYVGIPFSTLGLTLITVCSASDNTFKDLDSVLGLFITGESIALLSCEMFFAFMVAFLSVSHLDAGTSTEWGGEHTQGGVPSEGELFSSKFNASIQREGRHPNWKRKGGSFFFFFSPVSSGIMGSLATIFSKATFIGLVSVLLNEQLTLRHFFLNYKVALLIILTIICSFAEIAYTPFLLKYYTLTHVVSLKSFGNISFNAVNGMAIFDERPSCVYAWTSGFLLILVGIILLSYKSVIPKALRLFNQQCRQKA
ncbi:magnesium transporter, putative [Plasmodium vivax]|nr:magnesium transporter, putative [Plasmodium vivax]